MLLGRHRRSKSRLGPILELMLEPFGAILESFWDPFGIVFEIYTHSYELTYSSGAYQDKK